MEAADANKWWWYASVSYPTQQGHSNLKDPKIPNFHPDGGKGVVIYLLDNFVLLSDPTNPKISQTEFRDVKTIGQDDDGKKALRSDNFHGNICLRAILTAAPKAEVYVSTRGDYADKFKEALEGVIKHRKANHANKPAIVVCPLSIGTLYDGTDSLGFGSLTKRIDQCYGTISEMIKDAKMLVVASAGNSPAKEIPVRLREMCDEYAREMDPGKKDELKKVLDQQAFVGLPALHPDVLTVGGYDDKFNCRQFYHGTGVDVYAPATDFPVPRLAGCTYPVWRVDGTSYAAPLVAGCIASYITDEIRKNSFGFNKFLSDPLALKKEILGKITTPIFEYSDTSLRKTTITATGYLAIKSRPGSDKIVVEMGSQQVPPHKVDDRPVSLVAKSKPDPDPNANVNPNDRGRQLFPGDLKTTRNPSAGQSNTQIGKGSPLFKPRNGKNI